MQDKPTSLVFPVVSFLHGRLVVHPEKSFRAIGAGFQNGGIFTTLENRVRAARDGWLMGANGEFYELRFIGKSREWSRPIAFLWNSVVDKYEVNYLGSVSVSEALAYIDSEPDSKICGSARSFKQFLKENDSELVVDEKLLSQWPL